MNIRIGTELSLNLKDLNSVIPAFFIGKKEGSHIALALSDEHSKIFMENKNISDVAVQYSAGEYRYEFNCALVNVLDDPAAIVVLSFPDAVNAVDRRSLCRINCLISAKLENKTGTDRQAVTGVIENISKTGCLCRIEGGALPFSINEDVCISCSFPGLMGEQASDGKIVRILEGQKDPVVGIHFNEKAWWVPPYNAK